MESENKIKSTVHDLDRYPLLVKNRETLVVALRALL